MNTLKLIFTLSILSIHIAAAPVSYKVFHHRNGLTYQDFDGGKTRLEFFLHSSVVLSRELLKDKLPSLSIVRFEVDTLGIVNNCRSYLDVGPKYGDAIAKAISKTSGKWKSFYINDKKENCGGILFVNTKISADGEIYFTLTDKYTYDAGIESGARFLGTRDYKSAIACFDSCIVLDDNHIDAYFNRALAYFKSFNKECACADLHEARLWGDTEADKIYNDSCKGTLFDSTLVYLLTDSMPQFDGGEEAMLNFISKNIKYPVEARQNNISGTIYISFVIDEKGNVRDSYVMRGIGGGCDTEALRVVNLTNGHWKPGSSKGKTVSIRFFLPIVFRM